jgi:urease accessory protein
MARDADAVRAGRPTIMQSLTQDPAATEVLAWVRAQLAAVT